jgi:Family of unknown function (DUF6166)
MPRRHKTYSGTRNKRGRVVVHVIDECGDSSLLSVRLDLYRHSPSGFEYGYGGSGPAQLALAILADCMSDDIAISCHHKFKWKVIAKLDRSAPWVLKGQDVVKFVLDMMVPMDENGEKENG